MNDNERDKQDEELMKLLSHAHTSGAGAAKNTDAARSPQSAPQPTNQANKSSSPETRIKKQAAGRIAESKTRRVPSNKGTGRKTAGKLGHPRMIIIGIAAIAVLTVVLVLILKSCSGGDILKGTWDYDGVTLYRFDGKGKGSLESTQQHIPVHL